MTTAPLARQMNSFFMGLLILPRDLFFYQAILLSNEGVPLSIEGGLSLTVSPKSLVFLRLTSRVVLLKWVLCTGTSALSSNVLVLRVKDSQDKAEGV